MAVLNNAVRAAADTVSAADDTVPAADDTVPAADLAGARSPAPIGHRPPPAGHPWQPAGQQPDWADPALVAGVRDRLARQPALVGEGEVHDLHRRLADVASGEMLIVQAGDCAEDLAECTPDHVRRKVDLLHQLAGVLRGYTGRPVLRVGRLAGQFAKPRSADVEWHGGLVLPVFRGQLVNDPRPEPAARRPDPLRLPLAYQAADRVVRSLRRLAGRGGSAPVWTSHEALVLDYELPQIRPTADGRWFLASTHWPWIGDRTRDPHGAHVGVLSEVRNPVACKIGPGTTVGQIRALAERLDPHRVPGRLTLIARLGAPTVASRLPALVDAVRAAGHPVIWLCDPMHGNTVTAPDGRKTRLMSTILREIHDFRNVLAASRAVAGGLHLEVTPQPVTECLSDHVGATRLEGAYTTLCDPRLNPDQAMAAVRAWGVQR